MPLSAFLDSPIPRAASPRLAMRKRATLRLLAAATLLGACTLGGCALQSSVDDRADGRASALRESGGRYTLGRPFDDFYASAFVLTADAKGPPRVVSVDALAAALSGADVIFYGENHGHPGVHLGEMRLLRALYRRDPRWILSLEQFERDTQGVLDDYLAGRIGEHALTSQGRAWNNYGTSYRPLILFAARHHLPVVAAEAPGWAVSCVGQSGIGILERFTPLERGWIASSLDVGPGPYRDRFMAFLGGSPSHGGGTADHGTEPGTATATATPDAAPATPAAARAERSFAAQVVRDDTMAESIERALERHPGSKVLHITGSFHSAGFLGTVERLRRLNPRLAIAVIEPVEVEDPAAPAFAVERLADGTALQLIYPAPEDFLAGEDTSSLMTQMTHERALNRCRYSLSGEPGDDTGPAANSAPAAAPTRAASDTQGTRTADYIAAGDSGRICPPSITKLWPVT